MKRDIVIYIGGGGMLGVFGAGVVTALEEMNGYPRIKAVYGASAGALDAAYFLAHRSALGSSIYYEDLLENFIHLENLVAGALQRMWNGWIRPIPREKIVNAVDIKYALDVIRNKKPLDIDAIFGSGIGFYIEVFNVGTGETEWRAATKENIWQLLRASASAVPYWFPPELMDRDGLIDGTIGDPTAVEYLLGKYPDEKIILIINEPVRRGMRHKAKGVFDAVVARSMFGEVVYRAFLKKERKFRAGMKRAMAEKRVLVIHPPIGNPTYPATTDKRRLLATYEFGKQAARAADLL